MFFRLSRLVGYVIAPWKVTIASLEKVFPPNAEAPCHYTPSKTNIAELRVHTLKN